MWTNTLINPTVYNFIPNRRGSITKGRIYEMQKIQQNSEIKNERSLSNNTGASSVSLHGLIDKITARVTALIYFLVNLSEINEN